MADNISTELKLPISARIMPLVQAHLRELGALARLSQDKIGALELSIVEACTNIMKYAFSPDESDTFILRSELTPSALTVSLIDRGIPFDESLSPPCPMPVESDDAPSSTSGTGLCLIRNLVDRMEWINHGRAGKELRLTLYDVKSDITGQSHQEQLAPFREDEALAQEQHYRIRRLQPEDAASVSRIVFRAYGYTYPTEDLYYPERIVSLNRDGKLISVVAESASGEIVGYCALKRPTLAPVAEVGQAVVNPAHRGRTLLERMHTFLEEEALKHGVVGLALLPVTNHTHSQKTAEHLGSKVSGLALGLLPNTMVFKKLHDEPLRQRESCLFCFKYLKPPRPTAIYAPDRHREILRKIYDHVEIPVSFIRKAPPAGAGRLEVRFNSALGVGEIVVTQIGVETAAVLRQARRDLSELAGAAAIYLQVPLTQSGAPDLCRLAEREGFFFGALCPAFAEDGDALLMQYLNTEIDISLLQVSSSWAREILEYVEQERMRIGQNSTG